MPFRRTEEAVLEHVPTDVPLTITVTESKGVDATVDLATRLSTQGYRVAPHLAARLIEDRAHADGLLARLADAGVERLFIIGGDAPTPAGKFTAAADLLRVIEQDSRFRSIGIGGYPEGHAHIGEDALWTALADKAPMASELITQICFDEKTTVDWARAVHRAHPELEVRVGVPAPVSKQKLVRISAGIGLGQSARFLQKQQNVVWRLMRPGGYRPDKLLRALTPHLCSPDLNIGGIHLFTFNELERTEKWRQALLARLGDG
ncbi:methylenetetrahydrofolate reductase [Nocardia miyunensis]|uniref:methylenetetrahydrofolate reductase n=1 Tax=Nocardia miyunensis TaxID=282684 RepID=UPI0012F4944A|nr:methylenetetrahydrofolate reductase [Nocardia miyunensis]